MSSFTLNLPDHIGDQARTPSVVRYVSHLGVEMATPKHLLSEINAQLEVLGRPNHISIRDAEKIMSAVSLLPDEAQDERIYSAWRVVVITLIITRLIRPDLFPKLLKATVSEEELIAYMDATDENISQTLPDGQRNENFDSKTLNSYLIWKFIRQDGVMDQREEWPPVARCFDSFGVPHNVKGIPASIYDDWLSVFKLT